MLETENAVPENFCLGAICSALTAEVSLLAPQLVLEGPCEKVCLWLSVNPFFLSRRKFFSTVFFFEYLVLILILSASRNSSSSKLVISASICV